MGNRSWQHTVHRDSVAAPLVGRGSGKRANRLVGSRIWAVSSGAGEAHRGGHRDDPTKTRFTHVRVHSLHRPKRPFRSCVVQEIHIGFAHIDQRGDRAKALGVGDQPINTAPAINGFLYQIGGSGGISRVDRPSQMVDFQPGQLGAGCGDPLLFASVTTTLAPQRPR